MHRRGEVWWVNLEPIVGAEMNKVRPAVIVGRDDMGRLPLRVVVPVTSGRTGSRAGLGSSRSLPLGKTGWTRRRVQTRFRSAACLWTASKDQMGTLGPYDLLAVTEALARLIGWEGDAL
jgi:mRNA interferase MazF